MWSMLVVGLLFLAGAAYNTFGPEPNPTEALGGVIIAAILISLFFAAKYHEKQAGEFEGWITHNVHAIERGGALYQNEILVTPATVLTRYQVVFSFLIVTYKLPTRIYIVGHQATGFVATVCTMISLVFGWWGIPWGPIYTVQVVARNVRGGFTQSVAERLAAIPEFVRQGLKATGAA
jgi:hypothetical protein